MKKSRITMFILTMILAVGMVGSSVFAAADGSTPERMKNGKGDKNAGYILLQKQFDMEGKTWPNKTSFDYKISKVMAWDNSNESTNENGSSMTKADMPAPNGLNPISGEADTYQVNVPVKTESGTTAKPLVNSEKTATGQLADIKFDFDRPGYYLYKFWEVDDEVNGVTYDKHAFYVAFYVANKTADEDGDGKGDQNGETTGGTWTQGQTVDKSGIYVHTVTVFRSAVMEGTNPQQIVQEYIPAAIDPAWHEQSAYYALTKDSIDTIKTSSKEYFTYNPNAEKNQYVKLEDNSKAVEGTKYYEKVRPMEWKQLAAENVEKVGKSNDGTGEGKPNEGTVKFWNKTDSKDVTVEKKVTGTLGDLNKKFEFTVAFEKLAANTEYTVNLKMNESVAAAEIMDSTMTAVANTNTATFKSDANGNATIKFKMKAKQKVSLEGLALNANYTVTEAASDHKSSVAVTGADGSEIATPANTANDQPNRAISTSKECVDSEDANVNVLFTNHRDFETETGIPNFVFPVALAGILALIALAVVRRRKNVATVNDFEF